MADAQQLAILMQGVDAWNRWRLENTSIRPDLRCADLSGRRMNHINLQGADLTAANLSGAVLRDADLSGVCLRKACLCGATLSRSNLSTANLEEADLQGAHLSGAILCAAYLAYANLRNAHISRANLTKADFMQAHLSCARLDRTDCTKTNFGGAHLEEADFSYTKFDFAHLAFAHLQRANLSYACFFFTSLHASDLQEANLSNAIFRFGDLNFANLSRANLNGTIFDGTRFWMTNLSGATIHQMAVSTPLNMQDAKQTDLVITDNDEPTVTVDDLDMAQYVSLFLCKPNVLTAKLVFITGHFSAERDDVVRIIKEALRAHGYVPLLLDQGHPSTTGDVSEMLTILAHLARFIIIDLTGAEGMPDALAALARRRPIPLQPLLDLRSSAHVQQSELAAAKNWILPIFAYEDPDSLRSSFETRVILPCEQLLESVQASESPGAPST